MSRLSRNAMLLLLCTLAPIGGLAFQPAQAATSMTPTTVSAEKKAAAMELAQLVFRYDKTLDGARIGFQQSFDQSVRSDPTVQAMERDTPGFIAFLEGRMWENAVEGIAIMHPILVQRAIALFEQELTLDQTKDIITFIRSPIGKKVQSGGLDGVQLDQGYLSCLQEGGQDCVSAATMTNTYQQAGRNVVKTLTVEELQEIFAFQQTDAGKALFALNPKIAQITAEVVNELMPEFQARSIGTARTAVADWRDMQKETKSQ